MSFPQIQIWHEVNLNSLMKSGILPLYTQSEIGIIHLLIPPNDTHTYNTYKVVVMMMTKRFITRKHE